MRESTIAVFLDHYENKQTHELVDGVTIIVDGALRHVLDELMERDPSLDSYQAAIVQALTLGLIELGER